MNEGGKSLADAAALLAIGGTFAQILPPIAAGMAIVWHCIRFYEWWKGKKD